MAMNMGSLRVRIIVGFMASVAVAVVAFGLLLAIGVRFNSAEAISRAAVADNRVAASLGRHAADARVALYRYLFTVNATDRAALDQGIAALEAGSVGTGLSAKANTTGELIQKSQLSGVQLFASVSSIATSLKTLGDLLASSSDEGGLALARHANSDFAVLATDLGRMVSLREERAAKALTDDLNMVSGALRELQGRPGLTSRMKKVGSAALRDVDVLQAAVAEHQAVSERRATALDALTVAFHDASDHVQGRIDASNAAFSNANQATAEASWLLMTSLLASCVCVLVIGVVLALVIAGSITRPVVALTRTMRRLADGDFDASISGQARRDELGAMARAVEVFKANGLTLRSAERARAEAARDQSQAVAAIGAGLARLAHGDLTCRLHQEFPPDYRSLQQDFNAAMEQLQVTMRTVADSADCLRAATGGISGSADDLSRRTEMQAASLEQTAHSLEEITATVSRTAEGASHARDMVGASTADAERSGSVVASAMEAMAAIEQSSAQIAEILGVIDQIATQTSLLSLNAGIEAARAGDAGRGFAVVASEVRGLAQRSAEAAQRIKELIGASRQQVGSGVELVGQAGEALQRIGQVAKINAIVGDIAGSAREQATALAEVNAAVAQMDQATRNNAVMVEDTTAASHTLARQAEDLARLMQRFDVGVKTPTTAEIVAFPRAA